MIQYEQEVQESEQSQKLLLRKLQFEEIDAKV